MIATPAASRLRFAALIVPALLLLVTALLYGHTLQVPFYLDDNALFNGTYRLRDLPASFSHLFSQRGLTNLTFAVNYRCSGWALPPLHLVNIVLHAGCGVLVWQLFERLGLGRSLAGVGALLFVAHPLQTQGVTYLVQRSTVLGACFFLLAVLAYLRAREALASGHPLASGPFLRPYLAAVAAGACAVLAKENTAILPLVLFAFDRIFPVTGPARGRRLWLYLPFCLVPTALGLTVLATQAAEKAAGFANYPLESLQHNSPLHYLVTQFSVIWVYLRLLLLPFGQALEHDYPVVAELVTLPNAAALSGLLVLSALVWRVRKRRPLLAFGVVWFFAALAVESSIIPLDPLFEHRLYLPMFGFLLVVLDLLPALLGERWAMGLLLAALLVMIPLTWQRNDLWNDPVAFYEDNLRTVPGSERAMIDLAVRYEEVGQFDNERALLESAVRLRPRNHEFYTALAEVYAAGGQRDAAFALLERGIDLMPGNLELYESAAMIAEHFGETRLIFTYLQRGLSAVEVNRERLLNDLGIYYAQQGEQQQAEATYRKSLEANRDNPVALQYLAGLLFSQGRWQEAMELLRVANQIEPGNPKTQEGLVKAALKLGDLATARWAAGKLQVTDRQLWEQLQGEIRFYEQQRK